MEKLSLTPRMITQTEIDFYVAKGRRARSDALRQFVETLFTRPAATASKNAKVGCAA